MTTQINPSQLESTGAINTDLGYCIRIPSECVNTLNIHNLLLSYTIEHKGNYYLTPAGMANNDVLEVLLHTSVAPDS